MSSQRLSEGVKSDNVVRVLLLEFPLRCRFSVIFLTRGYL